MTSRRNRLLELMDRQRRTSMELADQVQRSHDLVREARRLLDLDGPPKQPSTPEQR